MDRRRESPPRFSTECELPSDQEVSPFFILTTPDFPPGDVDLNLLLVMPYARFGMWECMASFCPFRITTSMTRILSFSKTTFADFGATFSMCSTKSCSEPHRHLRYFKVQPRPLSVGSSELSEYFHNWRAASKSQNRTRTEIMGSRRALIWK